MKKYQTKQGFTLLELMISIFIFSVVVVVVATIFSRGMVAYQYANSVQKGLEEAQFTMGQIAKVLRTSSIILPTGTTIATGTTITVFDASQTKCVKYIISGGVVSQQKSLSINMDPSDWCGGVSYGAVVPMTNLDNGKITGSFSAVKSTYAPPKVGRASMVFVITAPNGSSSVHIQSSVSLRDYKVSGLL